MLRIALLAASVLLVPPRAPAQFISVTPSPATPGAIVNVTIWGSAAQPLHLSGTIAFLLTDEGDLVTPRFRQSVAFVFSYPGPPGIVAQLRIPPTGAGSSGSHVVYVPDAITAIGPSGTPGFCGLATRLDIGTATPGFAALHTFPLHIDLGFGSYFPSIWAGFGQGNWVFANTSASPVTLGSTDNIQVFSPGGTVPLLYVPLAGLTIPPNQAIGFTVPLATLGFGPSIVQVSWNDPLAGPVVRRTGVQSAPYPNTADLHLPSGRTVPAGGSIEAYLNIGTTTGLPSYALLVGFQPGTTTIAPGVIAPLALDPLVLASLSGALGPLLSNAMGIAAPDGPICLGNCPPSVLKSSATGMRLFHPGPVLSGAVLRLAAVAVDPTGLWLASQPQEITLQ